MFMCSICKIYEFVFGNPKKYLITLSKKLIIVSPLIYLNVPAKRAAGGDLSERDDDVDEHDEVGGPHDRRLASPVLPNDVLNGALRVEGDAHVRGLKKLK